MALQRADMLIYPTAIGWESSDTPQEQKRQQDAWIISQRGHAVANGLPVVAVNRVGHEPDPSGQTNGIQFWGHSFVCGPQGEILAAAPDDSEWCEVVEIDLTRSENVRRWWPFLRDRRIDSYTIYCEDSSINRISKNKSTEPLHPIPRCTEPNLRYKIIKKDINLRKTAIFVNY